MSYSVERNAQIIVSLLKQHGVRKVIISPGTTNIPIVLTLENDPFFELYSSVDERSAAYMACGMAATSGEPVALSCTGATASRNYVPGLTEAFYRKLPVIAITSFNGNRNIGQLLPQNLDRTVLQNDIARKSVQVPVVRDEGDALYCNRIVNDALLESTRNGGGPVHINVETGYDPSTASGELPRSRCIRRYTDPGVFPRIKPGRKIAVLVGAHRPFSPAEEEALGTFAQRYDAVVLRDHTSNYHGRNAFLGTLAADNTRPSDRELRPDLIIVIGEISGDYPTANFLAATHAESWRVSPDGEIRDRFGTLTSVFQCEERAFFDFYANAAAEATRQSAGYHQAWARRDAWLRARLPELPFSGRWIAQHASPLIAENTVVHFAILNALRSWNYFPLPESTRCFCNTGGFGIDGALSTTLGSALAKPDAPHLCVIGDLAFFYDMNALGNRHLPGNIRILLINNGVGDEMHMSYSIGSSLGNKVFDHVAAAGHFQSRQDHSSAAEAWAEAMGFRYTSAQNKEEFETAIEPFTDPRTPGPAMLECFTTPDDDMLAGKALTQVDPNKTREETMKATLKSILPDGALKAAKQILRNH